MRIAVIGTRGFPHVQGGIEKHCEHLYPLLARKGCEVVVYCRKPYMGADRPFTYKGVSMVPLPCPRNKYFETFFHTLIAVFAAYRIKPDILHVHAIGPSFFAPLARLLGMKVVVTHEGPEYRRKKWGAAAKAFLRCSEYLGCRFSQCIIAVAEYIAVMVRRKSAKEVVVIPNGIDLPHPVRRKKMVERFGLKSGKYVLAVGRFVPEKGFSDLMSAYGLLLRKNGRFSDWKLVIVGDADHEDRYSLSLKRNAGSYSRIVLTGVLSGEELHEIYSHAGLFVIPSYYEGLPHTLLEAMSFGLPCLASDIKAHHNLGLPRSRFFPPGDISMLARKLERSVGVPLAGTEKMRQVSRITRNFNWEDIADRTLKVYNRVLNGKKNTSLH
ncbi:MAG: glycosyltransferase family 4 protein [Candidatus Omnitrophica bacterium]|nr:glycosyltransferase family 4 protein [Candidatus Omnitrophota bacterium]